MSCKLSFCWHFKNFEARKSSKKEFLGVFFANMRKQWRKIKGPPLYVPILTIDIICSIFHFDYLIQPLKLSLNLKVLTLGVQGWDNSQNTAV